MKKSQVTDLDFYKYFTGRASGSEKNELFDWIEKSHSNQKEFFLRKKLFIEHQLHEIKGTNQTKDAINRFYTYTNSAAQNYNEGISVDFRKVLRYAAMLAMALSLSIAGYYLGKNQKPLITKNQNTKINVPYGGKSIVVLPDGSRIMLNAGSKLTYNKNFGNTTRELFLEGEGFFEVEKHRYPLIVHTSHLDIKVLGTVFNIKSYPDENNIEATLLEGIIEVENYKHEKGNSITLKPNEKITYYKSKDKAFLSKPDHSNQKQENNKSKQNEREKPTLPAYQISSNIDVEPSVAWKDGRYIFEGEKLANLAKVLTRKFDVSITFLDESLKNYTYSGTLDNHTIEQILDALKLTSPLNYSIDKNNIVLSIDKENIINYENIIK